MTGEAEASWHPAPAGWPAWAKWTGQGRVPASDAAAVDGAPQADTVAPAEGLDVAGKRPLPKPATTSRVVAPAVVAARSGYSNRRRRDGATAALKPPRAG